MRGQFTLGVEEEFQIVDPVSAELRACVSEVLEAGRDELGGQIKPEMLQSVVEVTTHVCPTVEELRVEVVRLRRTLSALLGGSGLAMIAAGTHPFSHWQDQPITDQEHYQALERDLQDVVRSILIFGLHVHVALPDRDSLIDVMNGVRTYLPHMLALSASSPFWTGRNTGLKSYRTVVWRQFPRTGIPDTFSCWQEFHDYVELLVQVRTLDESRKLWWDLRPHPQFGTLEFRICDMPVTAEETIAVAALFQAIVARLYRLREERGSVHMYERSIIEENKWRAARYGLDGAFIDCERNAEVPVREATAELLTFVDDVVDELGSRSEIERVERILQEGTGADRQLGVYGRSGEDVRAVAHWLTGETVRGLE